MLAVSCDLDSLMFPCVHCSIYVSICLFVCLFVCLGLLVYKMSIESPGHEGYSSAVYLRGSVFKSGSGTRVTLLKLCIVLISCQVAGEINGQRQVLTAPLLNHNSLQLLLDPTQVKGKGKMHPCTATEGLYSPYGQ